MVVATRWPASSAASVMIQSFTPLLVLYADKIRPPSISASSFKRLSSSDKLPQSPCCVAVKENGG